MATIFSIIVGWFVVSIPVGIALGKVLANSSRLQDEAVEAFLKAHDGRPLSITMQSVEAPVAAVVTH